MIGWLVPDGGVSQLEKQHRSHPGHFPLRQGDAALEAARQRELTGRLEALQGEACCSFV